MLQTLQEDSLNHTPASWDNFINHQHGHLLQTWAWGELKSRFGWMPRRIQVDAAAAQILFKRLPLGLTIAYIPKGPVVDWNNPQQCRNLLAAVHAEAKKQRAIFLKLEPAVEQSNKQIITQLDRLGFTPADTIQPQTSLVLDISGDEQTILTAMKQKTRYNIRVAAKKGISVRQGNADEVKIFYDLSQITAERDDFGVHSLAYYQRAFELFAPEHCTLLLAEFEQEPLSAVIVFKQGADAYYFYGASSNRHRNRMPNYAVQWAAIQWAKQHGCVRYDLWGIPNANPDTLEAEFQNRHDGLWGVYRFKRGWGGRYYQSIGAFDFVYQPLLYQLYKLRRAVL
jgi:peptidoglycan pentaglycine glycine transferase (the first glycine)